MQQNSNGVPAGQQQSAPRPPQVEPLVTEVGKTGRGVSLVGGVVCVAIGGGAVYGLCTGAFTGGAVVAVIGGILGGAFLLLGLFALVGSFLLPNSQFVIDDVGIRMQGTEDEDWQVAWGEIAAIARLKAHRPRYVKDRRRLRWRETTWLEFIPAEPETFAADHPVLADHLTFDYGYWAYRFGATIFGMAGSDQIDAKLREFATTRFHGVIDKGIIIPYGPFRTQ